MPRRRGTPGALEPAKPEPPSAEHKTAKLKTAKTATLKTSTLKTSTPKTSTLKTSTAKARPATETKMARKLNLVADDAVNDVSEQIDALRNELADLAGSVSKLVSQRSSRLGSQLSARLSEGVERSAEHANELRDASLESLNAAGERARDVSLHLIDTVAAEVRKNPTRTLALTLGVGLILGLLSRSSR
jgi:ElaB/YqjD/DUF883 family membrane-anchored ribosome-binding protein